MASCIQGEGKRLSERGGDVDVHGVLDTKDGGGGRRRDPLDGRHLGLTSELDTNLHRPDVPKGQTKVHRMEENLGHGMTLLQQWWDGTGMERDTVFGKQVSEGMIVGLKGKNGQSMVFHGGINGLKMLVRPIGLKEALENRHACHGHLFEAHGGGNRCGVRRQGRYLTVHCP
jgi:hypothetical protein